jgi:phosphoribosylformylglycinamidine synthase
VRALFGETAGVAVVVAKANGTGSVLTRANDLGVPARVIGRTGGDRLRLRVNGQVSIDEPVERCAALWRGALEARLGVS